MLPTTRESEKERPPDSENPSPLPGPSVSPAGHNRGEHAPGESSPAPPAAFPLIAPALHQFPRRPCKVQQGKQDKNPANPCGARLPGECRKGTISSIDRGADGAQVVQVGRIKQAAQMGQRASLVPVPILPFSPSDPLRSCSSDPPAVRLPALLLACLASSARPSPAGRIGGKGAFLIR